MYDAWVVTCQDNVSSTIKKACIAGLRITDKSKRQILLNWQIGYNEAGRFVTAIHTPPGLAITKEDRPVGGGILVGNGLELKFGSGQPRRLDYLTCTPRQCMAEAAIDDGFIKEALANGEATLTVHTVGGPIPLQVSIKGIDKAISSTRTR